MKLTEFSVVSLIQKDFPPDLLHDNIPRILRSVAAHERGQDGVRGEHIGVLHRLGQLPDDGIVGGGHGVEDPVDPLQRTLILDVDPVIDLVVVLHLAEAHEVLGLSHGGETELAQLGAFHLLDDDPVVANGHGGLALFDLDGPVLVLAATLLLLPAAEVALTLSKKKTSCFST